MFVTSPKGWVIISGLVMQACLLRSLATGAQPHMAVAGLECSHTLGTPEGPPGARKAATMEASKAASKATTIATTMGTRIP